MTAMFSTHNPKLQITWDATSLGALQHCPRFYQYNIIEGRRSTGIDLEFGIFIHLAKEVFNKAILAGKKWQEAQFDTVKAVFEATLASDPETGTVQPWGGSHIDMWHCLGETKYRNKKGNAAKCPWSHKGKWFEAPAPEICGECGSPTETILRYLSDHKTKHRYNLLRMAAWWAEDMKDGPWNPTVVPGTDKPAVEMHFILPLATSWGPVINKYDDRIYISGYLDAVKEYGTDLYWTDTKSTTHTIGPRWGEQWDSNLQMQVYDWASPQLFPGCDLRGGLIEGVQVTQEGVSFGEHFISSSPPVRAEFVYDTIYWLNQAEFFAEQNYWPKNTKNCFLCQFKKVCSADPVDREAILEGNFPVKFWDPTKERT